MPRVSAAFWKPGRGASSCTGIRRPAEDASQRGTQVADEELIARAEAYVDEVWEDVVEDIRRLVKIRSVRDDSTAGPGRPWGEASHKALVQALEIAGRLGLDAHECEGYLGYADLPGASDVQVATIAHTDVVPEGLNWTVDPFDVTRKDGYLLGRGVLDDKGPCILSLYTAHFFARQVERTGVRLPYTLRCLIGNEEECEMGDVKWYLAHYPEPAFTFTPDAYFPLICGEKGLYHATFTSGRIAGGDAGDRIVKLDGGTVANAIPGQASALVVADAAELLAGEGIELLPQEDGTVRVVAHGIGGHASLPEGTKNAIGILASYLLGAGVCSPAQRTFLEFEELLCGARTDGSPLGIAATDDIFGPLTSIGGTIRTVDGCFVQTIDVRYPTATTDGKLSATLGALARAHGCSLSVDMVKPPFYLPPTSPEVSCLLDAYRRMSGKDATPIVIGGGTYARNFTRACAFGPLDLTEPLPSWVGPEHGADEGISEEALRLALKTYIVAVAGLMELDL